MLMGKVIQFPVARHQRRQRHAVGFAAFGELEQIERAKLKVFAAFMAGAVLVLGALQLATQ